MSAPYSDDMGKKAIAAVKRGERKKDLSQMFNISRNTLDLWLKREEKSGDCQAITNYQQGCRHKITDWQRFREFVREQGEKTQGQMAKLWGDNVNQQNISDALRKMGLSRKKSECAISRFPRNARHTQDRLTAIKNGMTSSAKHFKSD